MRRRVPIQRLALASCLLIAVFAPAKAVSDRTLAQLSQRLSGADDPAEQVERLIQIVWYEHPGGELEEYAAFELASAAPAGRDVLIKHFRSGPADVRLRALTLIGEIWDRMVQGVDPQLATLIGTAMNDADPPIRRAAATIAARRRLDGISNLAIDAASSDPSLRVATLHAIARNGEPIAARWVLSQLTSDDPRVAQTARAALVSLTEAARPILREQFDTATDPKLRSALLSGLLTIAGRDDLPRLSRYLEEVTDEAARQTVAAAYAALEAGRYRPVVPSPAEPLFDAPLESAPPARRQPKRR